MCVGPAVALALVAGCRRSEYTIPPVDGPLVLEVRYPTARPVNVSDSIALWGTIGTGKGALRVNGQAVAIAPNGGFATFLPLPPGEVPVLHLEASRGPETLRRSIPIIRTTASPPARAPLRAARGWVRLRRLPSDTMDSATHARPVYSRWTPGGALALPLPLGSGLPIDLETDHEVRVRLAHDLVAWVSRTETEPVAAPRDTLTTLGRLTLAQSGTQTRVGLEAAARLAGTVDVVGNQVRWTLFGARAGHRVALDTAAGLVQRVSLRDAGPGRVAVDLTLTEAPLGWRTGWRSGQAFLELRPGAVTNPGIDGLVVALDPGHPPEGAIGPTGLTEDSLTLAVALEAARRLRALGARPVLTRDTPQPVSLEARVSRAEAAGAELLVSIHANAPADGRPPESVDGTRIYWWQPQSFPLARALRDSVPVVTGQARIGTVQTNLAVLRPTWFPAALVEATALVMPVREAWLRSPEGIAAYAAGIIGGIQAWQRERFDSSGPARGRTVPR